MFPESWSTVATPSVSHALNNHNIWNHFLSNVNNVVQSHIEHITTTYLSNNKLPGGGYVSYRQVRLFLTY